MRRASLILVAVLLLAAGEARAASVELGTAIELPNRVVPNVRVGDDGSAITAWSDPTGADLGVFYAQKLPGDDFGKPGRIATTHRAASVFVAGNRSGTYVIGWTEVDAENGKTHARISVAAPGEPPGQPMDPVALSGSTAVRPGTGGLAVSADGSVAVAWRDAGDHLTRVTMRDASGGWHPPQTFTTYVELAGGAGSEFVAMWMQDPHPRQLYVAAGTPSTGLGTPEQLSESGRAADAGAIPQLVTNERGDALVTWSPGSSGFMMMGDAIAAAVREPGGAWQVDLSVAPPGRALAPAAALNMAGDALVAWDGEGITSMFRPAGGAFGPIEASDFRPGSSNRVPMALDGAGTAVAAYPIRIPDSDPNVIPAGLVSRSRDGAYGEPVLLSAPDVTSHVLNVRVRSDGTGHVAWIEYLADGSHRAWITALRTPPPPPPAPPTSEPPPPETSAARAQPLQVGLSPLPRRVTRRTLARGLRVTLLSSAASRVRLRLTGARRGTRLVLERRLAMAQGNRVVRLRVNRRRLAKLRRGTRLDLRMRAVGEGSAIATAVRRSRLR